MIYHFAPAFDRSFRRLPLDRRQHVHQLFGLTAVTDEDGAVTLAHNAEVAV